MAKTCLKPIIINIRLRTGIVESCPIFSTMKHTLLYLSLQRDSENKTPVLGTSLHYLVKFTCPRPFGITTCVRFYFYRKICLKGSLKNRQNKDLHDNLSLRLYSSFITLGPGCPHAFRLIKVKSIAECSPWSILQYF